MEEIYIEEVIAGGSQHYNYISSECAEWIYIEDIF